MVDSLDIVAVVGSLRRGSFNRRLAHALASLAPATLAIEVLVPADLPLYNQDLEDSPPAAWERFRERIRRARGVVFVTPEYNRSIPGAMKNAIDVGSRPPGRSVWAGKPAAVVSAAAGRGGGFGANHALRQCLVTLDMPTMPQPEVYLGGVDKLFDPEGEFADPAARELCVKFVQAFERWVRRIAP